MNKEGIWTVVPKAECFEITGCAPISTRWVDTDKGITELDLRARLVARDFKGGDKGRDDLFAETPPLEAKRYLLSRAVTRISGGCRKLMFIDAKKVHRNPLCEEDVYVQLPSEVEHTSAQCGKLN